MFALGFFAGAIVGLVLATWGYVQVAVAQERMQHRHERARRRPF